MFTIFAFVIVFIFVNMAFYKHEDDWYLTYTVIQLNILLFAQIWDVFTLKRIHTCLYIDSTFLDLLVISAFIYSIIIIYYFYWWFHEKICIEGYSNGINIITTFWYAYWPLSYSNKHWLYYQKPRPNYIFLLWLLPFFIFSYYFFWYNYHEALTYMEFCWEHLLYSLIVIITLVRLSCNMPIWYVIIHFLFFLYPMWNRFTGYTVYRIDPKTYPSYIPEFLTPYTIDEPETSPDTTLTSKNFRLLRYPAYTSCMHYNYPCLYWDFEWLYWLFLPFSFF